jgi:hypothetical protein
LSTTLIFATLDIAIRPHGRSVDEFHRSDAAQAWHSAMVARHPLRADEGAGHSASGFAFRALRHLRTLLTLRLLKGLAWCCDLLLPARHLSFGRLTRGGLSWRWHFDLLHVSNRHNVKSRPHVVGNQENSLSRWRYSFTSTRFLRKTCVWERCLSRPQPQRNCQMHYRRFDGAKGGYRTGKRSAMLISGFRSTL